MDVLWGSWMCLEVSLETYIHVPDEPGGTGGRVVCTSCWVQVCVRRGQGVAGCRDVVVVVVVVRGFMESTEPVVSRR